MIEGVRKKAPEHSQYILTANQRQLMQHYVIFNNMFDQLLNDSWVSAKFMNES